ncbi:nitrite reductase large subunit NirB [Halalkalibacter alkaliphilus]|uniref:Nitrite reductase large subunit NirB n=1 Tax=Halalkalibacter alkaliphilus TaxID=2917993 RepID=A0A9X2CWL1_9BACI|nr:nitrite reductase large subunit NirB [Halalkalibacter alkaliphilus]MCL7749681.1 nitrite reductase large subunit NirB [Halalkalibacter alkaliphilus]
MKKKKLILIGNGMAGINCIEEILENNPHMFDITVFGSEPHFNYNRIMLSTVLQGGTKVEDITLHNHAWYDSNGIKLYTGETVVKVDPAKKVIRTDKDREVSYDKLIFATGSVPFVLPIPGADKEGVVSFRTIEDCQKMINISKDHKKAIVIGGGLLGLEAARGLLNLGMEVDVVHIANYLMERQLDQTAAKMLQQELEKQGMNFLLEKATKEIIGESRVEGLRFKDGSIVSADAVVMAVGVRPNVQMAKDSGLETNRAIVVNDYLQTSIPDIYAVGECVEHRGMVYGLVKPLYEQGRILAKHICGIEENGYQGSTLSTQLKISGVDVFSVGQFHADETSKTITQYDELAGIYKKIVLKEDKVIGSVMFGDTKAGNKLLDMISKQKVITDEEKMFVLQSSNQESQVAAMEQTDLICNCNGVTKGTIIEACQSQGLTTAEEVKKCTKASSACGGCKPLVTDLLAYMQSEDFDEVIEKETLCGCTTLTDEEIVTEMQLKSLNSIDEVMRELDWRTEDGCPTCRPALQYYLGMIYPEYETKQESLFINERMNATRQADGTYSLTPQMYGGLTNAKELRKVADVVEKYQVPNVAITSEQRLHLTGVKKEDLESIWRDLDLPLSSTYGNTVQNIKTCIGETVCKCDKQDALELAVQIEKKTDYLTTPYRVKMGISSCMHNGAGSTTKDIGIIQFDRGWEVYVGGSSGRNARTGQLLCVAETEQEVYEIVIGFIQYYRETAKYAERSWEWIDRINLLHIREVLFDSELRQQLIEALESDSYQNKKVLLSNK